MADVGFKITAQDNTKTAFDSVGRSLSGIQNSAASVSGALAAIGVGISVGAFVSMTKQIVAGLDAMNDLKDATGATIENISALEDVARRTGSSFETVSTALTKLNKGLSAAKPGSDTEAAIKAIGLSVKDLKALDPAEAFRQVAVGLSGFADDANKARLVQELFGKSLKEVAPLLKDLGESGRLVATVTTEQAEAAEQLAKQFASLEKNALDLGRSLVSQLIPSLNALGIEMAAAKKTSLGFWDGVAAQFTQNPFKSVSENAAVYRDQLVKLKAAKDEFGKSGGEDYTASIDKDIATAERRLAYYNEIQRQSIQYNTSDQSAAEDARLGVRGRGSVGEFATTKPAKEKLSDQARDYATYLESLDKRIQKEEKLTEVMKAQEFLGTKKYTPRQQEELLDRAKLIDTYVAEEAATKAAVKAYNEYHIAQEKILDGYKQSAASAEASLQKYADEEEALQLAATKSISLAEAIEDIKLARVRETRAKELAKGADGATLLALQKEIEAREKIKGFVGRKESREAATEAAKASAAEWQRGWQETDRLARDVFTTWATDGSNAAQKIGDTLKKALLSAIYEATLKPVVFNIYSSLTGGSAINAAAGGSGGSGNLFSTASTANSLYSNGSSLYTVGSQYFGGTMSGANAVGTIGANATGTGIDGLLATNGAYGTAAGSSGGAAAGAAGAAEAGGSAAGASAGTFSSLGIAGMILYGMHLLDTRGGGYVKATGSADSNFNSAGMITGGSGAVGNYAATRSTTAVGPDGVSHTTTMPVEIGSPSIDNTFAKNMVRDANAAYLNATKLLGIKAVDSHFTYDSNSSDGGKFALTADAGGKSFNSGEIALNDNALKLAAGRAVITALQGSELPKWMSGVFDNLNASTLDQAGVDATITHAGQLREAFTALSAIPDVDLSGISYETLDSMKGMATELAAVDIAFSALGYKLFDISAAGAAAAQGLAQAFGGLQNFQAQTAALFQNYYTPAEQRQQTYQSVADQLKAAGITGITTADIAGATREQIRTVVDTYAAKVGTTDGDRQYAAIVAGANTLSPYVAGFADPNKKPDAPYQERGSSGGGGAPVQDAALSAWQDATDAIIKTMSDLRTTLVDSGPDSYAKLQAQFAIEAASAKAGNLSAAQDLPALAKALVDAGKSYNTSSVQQALLTARVLDTLGSVAGVGSAGANLSIPKFAAGGYHAGGWALVGEQGPELVNMPSARVYTAQDTRAMLGGGTDPAVLEKLSAIERELSAIRAAAGATAVNTGKSAKVLVTAANGGQPLGTTAVV